MLKRRTRKYMETEKKSHGALIGSIIIIVILLIGGVYIWQSKMKNAIKEKTQQEQSANAEAAITDNELNTLEQDINSIDTAVDVDIDKVQ